MLTSFWQELLQQIVPVDYQDHNNSFTGAHIFQ